jgi:hypothetical protein
MRLGFYRYRKAAPMLLELFRGRTERIRFDRKQHFSPIRRKTQ